MALTATYQTTLDTNKTTTHGLATATATYKKSLSAGFASAQVIFTSAFSLVTAGGVYPTKSYTLSDGSGLKDAVGDNIYFSAIDFIRVRNTTANGSAGQTIYALGYTNAVDFGLAATSGITIATDHHLDIATSTGGLPVTSGSTDVVRVEHHGLGSTATTFELVIIGRGKTW